MDTEEDTQQKRSPRGKIAIPRHPRQSFLFVLIITLLVLLSSSAFLGYRTIYKPYRLHAQQTAIVQARSAATSYARATNIAVKDATEIARVAATATILADHQNTYNEITNAFPTLNDDLRTPDIYDWDTGSGCVFTQHTYTTTVTQKGFFLPCLAKHATFSNFAYQVSMSILKGDAGGLIIRANTANAQSYLFVVGQDGTYSVYYYAGAAKQRAQTLTDGYSDTINTGHNQQNILGVVASGTSLDFYINKKYVTSVIANQRESGVIGVLANNYTSTTEVVYTQAQVWKLG